MIHRKRLRNKYIKSRTEENHKTYKSNKVLREAPAQDEILLL